MPMSIEEFIHKYIKWIDKNEWEYVYQEAELYLEYAYELTSTLLKVGIDPLPYMSYVPCSYAPLEISEVNLPATCTHINWEAFNSCENLTSINLPEGLEVIDSSAFANSGLKELHLPSTIEILGPCAFANCKDLKTITYNGTIDQINKIRVWEEVFEGVPAHYIDCIDGKIELRDIDE